MIATAFSMKRHSVTFTYILYDHVVPVRALVVRARPIRQVGLPASVRGPHMDQSACLFLCACYSTSTTAQCGARTTPSTHRMLDMEATFAIALQEP